MRYKASTGSHFTDEDAQVIGDRISSLGGADGVTAKDLVRDARRRGSPLHKYFEWDDTKAAEAHREAQAREMIRCVVVISDSEEEDGARGFHAVVVRGERRYLPYEVVFGEPLLRDQVIADARREAEGWRRRYERYRYLAEAVAAMDTVVRKIPKRQKARRRRQVAASAKR